MPKPDLIYDVESTKAFLKGRDLVKVVLKDWAEDAGNFKCWTTIDYLISHFKKGIKVGIMMLNRLWEMANTNHVNLHWVPLLGEIILNDKKMDFVEILSYNLNQI